MYARITNFQVKPDRIDDMTAQVDSVRGEVRNVAGLTDSYSVWRADGKGSVTLAHSGVAAIRRI